MREGLGLGRPQVTASPRVPWDCSWKLTKGQRGRGPVATAGGWRRPWLLGGLP